MLATMWMEQHVKLLLDRSNRFSVFLATVVGLLAISKSAHADAFVPVVAVLDLPLAIISIFWIAPLEAGIVRLREPGTRYGSLLWDFWLANWISLIAGIVTVSGIFGILMALDALGVYAHFPRMARWAELVRPFEPDGSKRPFSTIFLVSLVWVAVTFPVTVVVEARFLRRRWENRVELVLHSPMLHSVVVNLVSYTLLLLGLSALFLHK